jgi:alkanesulfonate monooxygenase SsuD/methylene tetrahydromethanopterin reductase-like flavin-dependent oxidoreductase (luciferase family)
MAGLRIRFPSGRRPARPPRRGCPDHAYAWRDGRVSFEGKHYQVDGAIVAPKPLQPSGIPLWIAGGGEKVTLRIAAKTAVHQLHLRAGRVRTEVADPRRALPEVGTDYGAIVRSANVNAVLGSTEGDVEQRIGRVRDRLAGIAGEARPTR